MTATDNTPRRPGLIQRIVLFFLRRRAAEVEASTKEWTLTCPNCSLERTLWDVGGVRWGHKRRGKKEAITMKCPRCGQREIHPLRRETAART